MYLTYAQYQAYGGTLDETTFNDYEFEARTRVDWYTFNRLQNDTTFPESVTRCMYKLIQLIEKEAKASQVGGDESGDGAVSAGVASQSNDGVSISYNVLSAKDLMDSVQKDVELCIKHYLQSVTNSLGYKLLYRGMYPGE